MNTTNKAGQNPVNEWSSWIVIAAIAVVAWGAPHTSSKLWSSTGWRAGSSLPDLIAAYANLMHPEQITGSGMSGPRFGITVVSIFVVYVAGIAVLTARVRSHRSSTDHGFADRRDLAKFSADAAVTHSEVVLGHRDNNPARSATLLGRDVHHRRDVWVSKEFTILVLAPPRSGKTTGLVAPAVADHHGPCVVTGVRHDILDWTVPYRRHSPMWLCEPTRPAGAAVPDGVELVRWSPLSGCDDILTARLRAEALFAALPAAGTNDEYWRTAGISLLAGLLMAGAARDGTMSDVVGWADRDSDASPVEILHHHATQVTDPHTRDTITGLAASVGSAIDKDPRYKAGVTGQMLQALEPFRLPQVRAMCEVPIAESFCPGELIDTQGTVWMLGSDTHQKQAAGVCTALTAAIIQEARDRAAANPTSRLQPPLLAALDEIVNVAPVPRLEQLLSTGGGSGIQTIVVLQSMAAARHAWGREMGDALLDFNNVKVVLGGLSDSQDLQDLSTLMGLREERVVQSSRNARTGLLSSSDVSVSWRQVPVMRPDQIRRVDSETSHHALVIARQAAPLLIKTTRIYERNRRTR